MDQPVQLPVSVSAGQRAVESVEAARADHSDHAWSRAYERQRQLRLARTLLPIWAVIEFLLFALSTLFLFEDAYQPPTLQIAFTIDGIEGLCVLVFALGYVYARRGQVGRAVACVLAPASVTILLPVLAYDLADLLNPSPLLNTSVTFITLLATLSTIVLIVLVNVLTASPWLTLGVTLLMNVFTALISTFVTNYATSLPTPTSAIQFSISPFADFAILTQWSVGGIMTVVARTQRATLRELETTRIAYERSKQLESLKDQFITNINHEVRSPVMALQGYIDLMQATETSATPEQRGAYVARAKRAADNLVALVRSILSVRSLEEEPATLDFQAVDLHTALRAAADAIDPREAQSMERELRLSIPAGLAVWGEPTRVRQILTNLLSNAVKYSAPGTPIEVSARLLGPGEQGAHGRRARRGAGGVRPRIDITVRDHGHGIPPDQIPLLFERFVRLPRDLASNVVGNGLGLYLCRAFAEAMGGRVWVESQGVEGDGSAFHVELGGVTAATPT